MNKVHESLQKLHSPDFGKLFIRLALGVVFINAGWFKLQNMDMVVQGFVGAGIPAFFAYLVGYVEFVGGIALILGILVQYAAILIGIVMLVALFKVHWVNGFSLANGGYEYVLVLLLCALSVLVQGAGRFNVLRFFKKN